MQLPGATPEVLGEILDVVRELSAGHPLVGEVHGLLDADVADARPGGVLAERYDDFFYAHDSTGTICRRLASAYPAARRICIGDAFGMVYPADYVAGYTSSPLARLRRGLGAFLRREPQLPALHPDLAALVLPVDPSGRGLSGIPLVCCSRKGFREAIGHCHKNASGLRAYMAELLASAGQSRPGLLLTENYSESRQTTPDAEIGLYALIVRRHCEPGSLVLVKPHPLEAMDKTSRLAEELGSDYRVVKMVPRYRRYPIEVWSELLVACNVICAAYPVLSLKYAHDVDVLQPMDEDMIEMWFDPSVRAWMRDGLRLYTEPLARLGDWDGKSVLWSRPG